MRSPVAVQPGTELELYIFAGEESNPITIDGAIVRWTKASEFGVSFDQVRAPVQRRVIEVWRKLASPF